MTTTQTPATPVKPAVTPADHHKKAATHLEAAAKHHHEAAKHHEAGDHGKAAECTVKAHGHTHMAAEAQKDNATHHATKS